MMDNQDIKVFDVDECIKTFRKTYKVPKTKKDTIINYIFNIYFGLKNNGKTEDVTNSSSSKNEGSTDTNQVQQNISIQLDSKGLNQLLSYINMIPKKYHLETKKTKSRINSSSSPNNILTITNNVDTTQVLQLGNVQYPLLTYENNTKNNTDTNTTNNTDKKKSQCMGRTAKHTRCSRSCKGIYEYCQSHINNKCPYGRFDEDLKIPEEKIIKKRGRKRKVEISDKFKDNTYVTLWTEIVEGDKRLVDRFNNVYTFDLNNPKFLGVKQLNGKINTSSPLLTTVF